MKKITTDEAVKLGELLAGLYDELEDADSEYLTCTDVARSVAALISATGNEEAAIAFQNAYNCAG